MSKKKFSQSDGTYIKEEKLFEQMLYFFFFLPVNMSLVYFFDK